MCAGRKGIRVLVKLNWSTGKAGSQVDARMVENRPDLFPESLYRKRQCYVSMHKKKTTQKIVLIHRMEKIYIW